MPIVQISPAELATQKGAEGFIYQDATDPSKTYTKGLTGNLIDNPSGGAALPASSLTSTEVPALQALVSGGGISLPRYSVGQGIANRYRADVVAAGATVSELDLNILRDTLEWDLIRTSVWPKLLELWVPISLTAAGGVIKLKGASTRVMTGNNLVDGDFTRWAGLTGNGSNKDISTGFSAASYKAAWGMAVYPTNGTAPAVGQILVGDGTATYLGFGNGDAKISGSATVALEPEARMMAIQNNSAGVVSYFGAQTRASTATPGASDGGTLRLLSYGGSFYSPTSLGGWAAWSGTLTTAELQALQRFFENITYRLGRNNNSSRLIACGDSNIVGTGLGSPTTQRFSALLAGDLGLTEVNNGIAGSAMSSTVGGGASDIWVTNHLSDKSKAGGSLLLALLGTNDDRFGSTAAGFAADYDTWLQAQFRIGWRPGNIMLVGPGAATEAQSSAARQQQFGATIRALATQYGCLFVDGYAATTAGGSFQGDGLHESVAGHIALKNACLTTIGASAYSGPLVA